MLDPAAVFVRLLAAQTKSELKKMKEEGERASQESQNQEGRIKKEKLIGNSGMERVGSDIEGKATTAPRLDGG